MKKLKILLLAASGWILPHAVGAQFVSPMFSSDWRVGGNTTIPFNTIGPMWPTGLTVPPSMWFTTGSTTPQFRMMIADGGIGNNDGRIAIGNDLPSNFIPRARLHLHQTGGSNYIQLTNNSTGFNSTDGTTIGIAPNGFTFFSTQTINQQQVFYTNNGNPAQVEERIRINADDINGFIGIGNTAFYTAAAQLHINSIGLTGGLGFAAYGQLFRTDGDSLNTNEWRMHTGISANNTHQVFNLRVPANTNNLQINTVNNSAVIELRTFNTSENTIATVTSTGGTGSLGTLPAIGGINIRPDQNSLDSNHVMNIGGPIKFSEPKGTTTRTTQLYGYTSSSGVFTGDDGFRMMFDPATQAHNFADYWIFQKTDGNNLDPDGGILFTNMGIDSIEELTMILEGSTNYVGIGEEFEVSVIEPKRRLEVYDSTAPQLRLAHTLNTNANNEIFADFRVLDTGALQIDPRNGGLTVNDVRAVQINYGLGNPAPHPHVSLDVNGQENLRTVNLDSTLTDVLVWDAPTGNIRRRNISSLGMLGNNCGTNTNPLNNDWEIPMNTYNFVFADPGTLQYGENFVGIGGNGCTPGAKLDVLLNPTSNSLPTVTATRIINHDASGLGGTANGILVETDGNGSLNNRGVMVNVSNAPNNIGIRSECVQLTNGTIAQNNRGLEGIAHEGGTNIGVTGDAFSNNTSTTQNIGGRFIANQGPIGTPVCIGVFAQAPQNYPNNWAGLFNGDVNINGTGWYNTFSNIISDQSIKKNVNALENALSMISQLQPKTYDLYNDNCKQLNFGRTKTQYGFIAQEVEKVIPNIVYDVNVMEERDGKGDIKNPAKDLKGISYEQLIPVLVKAIQEQQTIIQKQEADNKALTDRLNKLEECINKLQLCNTSAVPTNGQDNNGSTQVTTVQLSNTPSIVLDQNVPNPFAEQTVISYVLPDDVVKAQMLFYNANGKLINSVALTERGKGQLNVFANDLSSGVYTYTLVVDGKIAETKRMIKE